MFKVDVKGMKDKAERDVYIHLQYWVVFFSLINFYIFVAFALMVLHYIY
jgi:hypothetical protein